MEFSLSNISSKQNEASSSPLQVLIIGAGPAGMAAALYAARADLKPLVITGMQLGGQAALTEDIENYPGFPDGVGGAQLGDLFQKQAERFGARFEFDTVAEVDLSRRPFRVKTYAQEYLTQTLIISSGADPNHLNVPGEKELTGRGVSYCATCDGWFFKGKKVAVVGGGDSALEEALFLTRYASSITIVHRRDALRAGTLLQKRARENPKINFIWNTIIDEITGKDAVEGIRLRNVKTNQVTLFPIEGVFIFIGHTPNTTVYKGQLNLDEKGYIITDKLMQTNIPGVYAAGEAADPVYRQVITSAGMGAAAAIQATRFLEKL